MTVNTPSIGTADLHVGDPSALVAASFRSAPKGLFFRALIGQSLHTRTGAGDPADST